MEPSKRPRASGGGAKPAIELQPGLLEALDELVHLDTRGTPMSSLRWTLKSTYQLSRDLGERGFSASAESQAPAKQNEGTAHPDRDGQFGYINSVASERLGNEEPVISVDPKKKELIGNYSNGGREWQPAGEPVPMTLSESAINEILFALDSRNGSDLIRQLAQLGMQDFDRRRSRRIFGSRRWERTIDRIAHRNGHRPTVL